MNPAFVTFHVDIAIRPKLKITTRANVTKVIVEDVVGGVRKRAVVIEFGEKREGMRYGVEARKEVVLSLVSFLIRLGESKVMCGRRSFSAVPPTCLP
ncbi:hypothetical protein BD410DRAFT_529808 [Rickenella mellea]|uniref:Uncharacterized protein n=1 Tax=Rickenella mellea TaxID=50990 RepID=A0A4Y7QH94_9AGAM|nr:hypothetical protein BD410DRAFT_529808 [Rickenella mellea]